MPTTTGELGYRVAPDDLLEVCRTLRDEPELKFEMLIDVCGVDYQSYGKDEWQTSSATGTGFSRGTLREAPPVDLLFGILQLQQKIRRTQTIAR